MKLIIGPSIDDVRFEAIYRNVYRMPKSGNNPQADAMVEEDCLEAGEKKTFSAVV
jgi:hypothetical protein